jgi:hypothetical protein
MLYFILSSDETSQTASLERSDDDLHLTKEGLKLTVLLIGRTQMTSQLHVKLELKIFSN